VPLLTPKSPELTGLVAVIKSGCWNVVGYVAPLKNWKVGDKGLCRGCGAESINVKERTVKRDDFIYPFVVF
jgi:hypothetical protein